ncbi:MAG: prepilin-type N-terminal cleavage/methylation domain-containing protein [Steroidobacteraceae bacterium]
MKRRPAGFSLVELMVAMVIALIVVSAVVALVLSVLRTNAAAATSVKLTQDGRAIGDIVGRELRRARFAGNYLQFVGTSGAIANAFGVVDLTTAGCVKFSYDANANGVVNANEPKSLFRSGNNIYLKQSATIAASDCSVTNALRLNSPDVQVTGLVFTRTNNQVAVTLTLALDSDTTITRSFNQSVQLRNPFL